MHSAASNAIAARRLGAWLAIGASSSAAALAIVLMRVRTHGQASSRTRS
jgi:hypothetical protein